MNTDLSSLARTLAERLIRKVALETLTLAELRATIEMPEPDWTATDAADDAIGVMLGEDWGCLDPEDPDDAAKILKFVNECEAVIREAIEKTLPKWIPVADELPPKDGSEVILRVRRGGLEGSVVAHWMPGGHCIQDHPPIDEGWYWWNKSYFDISPTPTHWMRLPEFSIRSLKPVAIQK